MNQGSSKGSFLTRRELGFALSAFAALAPLRADAQTAEPAASANPDQPLVHSRIFAFDQLSAHGASTSMVTRPVVRGTLATGEYIEVHETTLAPGQMPHPPHRHTHSELLLVRDGTLEVHSEGQTGTVTAGGVIFTASAVLHSLKNIGTVPASYFVVAVGVQRSLA